MYISRKLEDTILKYLDSPEIIAVLGPRQCGKTTLLRHIYENLKENKVIFLTLEDRKVLDLFTDGLKEFVEIYVKPYKYVFIDEFQYAKKGGKKLKYIVDTTPRKIFISGSSSIDLTVQAVKYLVGRIFVFSLFPLDFEEYLGYQDPNLLLLYQKQRLPLNEYGKKQFPSLSENILSQIRKHYEEYAVYGGYPRVALSATPDEKKLVLKNIYNTYFLREVKDILGLVDDYKLAQIIKALALQIGSLIEYQEISRVGELSYPTVKSYLNFLEKTFICSLIKPFFKNRRIEIVKNPKVYFFDTGLRNYVVDDFREINGRTDAGALLENAVAMQLVKQELVFNFWRTKQKDEIDFVVNLSGSRKVALEIKKSADLSDLKARAIREFKSKYPEIPFSLCVFNNLDACQGLSFLVMI